MVIYEAAHAIVNMKQTTAKELAPAVSVLQLFCGSSKPTLRFAAVRTLNKVTVSLLYLSDSSSNSDSHAVSHSFWPIGFVSCYK